MVPGLSYHYATVRYVIVGEAIGLLVESHEGRPTKIEATKGHPLRAAAAPTADHAGRQSFRFSTIPIESQDATERIDSLCSGDAETTWAGALEAAFAEIIRTNLGDPGGARLSCYSLTRPIELTLCSQRLREAIRNAVFPVRRRSIAYAAG